MSQVHFSPLLGLAVLAATAASPAAAQDADRSGPYAVARAGVAADSDLKFKDRDAAAPSTVRRNEDLKPGFTGELGAGYDLGGFRLEGTVGYANASLDRDRAGGAGLSVDGRARQLTLGLSGYADIPTGSAITPYVGGGVGASRVDARLSRTGGTPAAGSRFSGKDWGFQWHVDAGVGIRAAENTTVDIGARYTRTSALEFQGLSGPVGAGAVADGFKPRLSSVSALVGVRQRF